MKWVLLAGILFVVITFGMRKRRGQDAARTRQSESRKGSMYDTDGGGVNVRSADNVRLVSDDQLSAVDGRRDKPVEQPDSERK